MSWNTKIAAGTYLQAAQAVDEDPHMPTGVKLAIKDAVAHLEVKPDHVVVVKSQGHLDAYAGRGEFEVMLVPSKGIAVLEPTDKSDAERPIGTGGPTAIEQPVAEKVQNTRG